MFWIPYYFLTKLFTRKIETSGMFHFCPQKFSSMLSGFMVREKGNNCFPFTFTIPLLIHVSSAAISSVDKFWVGVFLVGLFTHLLWNLFLLHVESSKLCPLLLVFFIFSVLPSPFYWVWGMGQRQLHQLYLLCFIQCLCTVIFIFGSYLMIFIHSNVFFCWFV